MSSCATCCISLNLMVIKKIGWGWGEGGWWSWKVKYWWKKWKQYPYTVANTEKYWWKHLWNIGEKKTRKVIFCRRCTSFINKINRKSGSKTLNNVYTSWHTVAISGIILRWLFLFLWASFTFRQRDEVVDFHISEKCWQHRNSYGGDEQNCKRVCNMIFGRYWWVYVLHDFWYDFGWFGMIFGMIFARYWWVYVLHQR